ncbi:MAG: NUDIX domain-containing protein, partial [Candidatus Binatia bacterium]
KSDKMPIRRELSAGGVAARQERGQWFVALLKTEHKRGEVWVLPKGHVELHKNERISEAARREVEEEAGLTDLSVKDQLGVTRFTFQAEDAIVRKTVHYFLMVTGQKKLVPQDEEDFIDAAWFPIDVAMQTLEYDTDQEIVAKAKQKLVGGKAAAPRTRFPGRRLARVHT